MMEPVAEDRIIKGINVRILKEQCERLAEPIRASTRSFQFASALDNCVVVINALEARELVLTKTIEQLQGPLSVAALVARAEAAEARIAEITKWRDEWKDMATELKGLVEEWQARADAAEAMLKEAGKALEPFADEEVVATWIDDRGWTEVAPKNDRICDWFGPSDFRAARAIHHKIGVKDE